MWAQEYWIDEELPEPSSGFSRGLVIGLAIGAAAALLLAPAAGAEMRRQVRDSAQRVGRRAAEAYDGMSHVVGDVAARSRRVVQAGREAVQSARSAETTSDAARVSTP